jgi:N-acetylneuraminate synthase
VEFSCTPFYLKAVAELQPYVAFYKVASYELLWTDLLKACAATQKPVIISTGMAIMPEIQAAVATLEKAGASDVTVLHCVSAYPSPPEQSNLAAIEAIRKATGAKVGWSDHSRSAVIDLTVHPRNAGTVGCTWI